MALEPGSALGPYAIRAELGHGGMGVVYTAYDPRLDRLSDWPRPGGARGGLRGGAARALSERHVTSREMMPLPLAHLAEAELRTKGPEVALATTEKTLRQCDEWGARAFVLRSELAQVRVLRAMGGASLARAAETVDRGLAHAERMEAHAWIPHFKQERAELARDPGDTQSYRTELNEAIALWREMGASGWVERATRDAQRAVDLTA